MADEADVEGGRIELEVVAEIPRGFEQRLQRQVERRVRNVEARIRAEIDARRLVAEARAAAEAAERTTTIRARVDGSRLRRDVAAAAAAASAGATVEVTPEVDAGRLHREVQAAAARSSAKVKVDADTTPAANSVRRFTRGGGSGGSGGGGGGGGGSGWLIKLGVKIDDAVLKPAEAKLRQLITTATLAAAKYTALGVAAGVAGSGLLALAASATQAVGVLGLLPGIAGAAVQGLAGLMVGMSGVGTALQALSQRDAASGASAASAAAAREAAAERIKQAERSIRDAAHARLLADERVQDARDGVVAAAKAVQAAEDRVKEAVERVAEARARVAEVAAEAAERQQAAARQVEMAERRLASSQRATQRAQEDLNEARKQAKERLEDLALAISGGALDEESAQLAIERAKERLEAVTKDPFASDLDKREADLAYRQALQRLKEVKERNGDLAEEQAEANAKGIEGSDEVTAAKERLADAIQAEKDAEYELGQERKEQAKAAADGAKSIAEANKAVAEAIKGVASAQDDVKSAQKAQIQAARDLREALWDQMLAAERLKDAQTELAKAKRDAATAGQTNGGGGVDPAAKALAELSPAMRAFVLYLHGQVIPKLKDVRTATQEALAPGLRDGVEAAMPLLDTVKQGLSSTGTVVGDLARDFGELLGSKAFSGYVSRIMGRNNTAIQLFGKAGLSAFKGITRIVDVSMPYVVKFADKVAGLADRFDKWTKTVRDNGDLDKFFGNAWEAADKLWRIVSNVGGAIMKVAGLALPSGNTLLEDLAQGAEDLNKWLDRPEVQERFKKFFDELVPLLRTAGGLLKDVVVFIGGLVEKVVVDGNLTGFLGWLRGVVQWLDKMLDNPVVAEIGKWLLIFGLAATAIGILVKKLEGLTSGLKLMAKAAKGISKLTGLSKLFGKGGSDDDSGGDSPLGKTKTGTMTVQAGKVYVNGATVGSGGKNTSTTGRRPGNRGTRDVDVPDTKGGKHRKTGGRGLGGAISSIIGDIGLDLLADIDWGKELKNSGLTSKLGGLLGKAKGGIVGTIAGLLVDPLADAFKGDANKGMTSAIAEALKSGSAGAGIGALVGSVIPGVGTAIGGAIGAGIGAVQGGIAGYIGPRMWETLKGNLLSTAPIENMLKTVGTLFGGAGVTINDLWQQIWRGLDNGTKAGADGLQSRLGMVLDLTNGKFVSLSKEAPKNLQTMWASIKKDLDAGISPSQDKINAFVKAGGAQFLKLAKDAPADLKVGWDQALLGMDTFTSVASNKLATFTNGTGGKFLQLKKDAPAHVQAMWADIQAKIAAGTPVSQKEIDDFIARGGGQFLKLRKDAPQHIRDGLSEINNNLTTGLNTASLKLGGFIQDGQGKFLKLRQDSPKQIQTMWADIQRDIDAGKQPSQQKIDAFIKAGGGSFLKLKQDAPATTKKTWADIAAGVDPGLKPAKDKVAAATSAMEKAFGTAKSGIAKIWDALPDSLKKPLAWIVNTAYGKIAEVWNAIAKAVNFPQLPKLGFANGGVVATGYGVQPGYAPGRDRMLAAVSPGEAWLRPELARALGTRWVDGANHAARAGGVAGAARFLAGGLGFAKGGTVGNSKAKGTAGGKKEQTPLEKLLATVSASVRSLFAKGLGAGARKVLTPIKNAISSAIGTGTQMQQLLGRIPATLIDKVISRFDKKDQELNRDRGGVLPPGRSSVLNATGKNEWVLTPQAVAALGGPRAVQRLNESGVAGMYRAARSSARPVRVARQNGDGAGSSVVNVYPQPGQSEKAIGNAAARRLGSQIS
ncbi:hypothetical protein ACIHFD_49180 [Nonomuraea sp. NPDC051941]|uniref:hypothetical protein n=1 Tax=Nonomuraea sp. NPDC051941 TaxID=3364373 RepID=UPI0037CA1235